MTLFFLFYRNNWNVPATITSYKIKLTLDNQLSFLKTQLETINIIIFTYFLIDFMLDQIIYSLQKFANNKMLAEDWLKLLHVRIY